MVNGEFNFYFQHSAFIIQHSEGYNLVDAVANLRRVLIIDSQVMASSTRLQGTELVDCARANAKQGIETAASQCGYGGDINTFAQALKQACEEMNLQVKELSELITDQEMILQIGSGEVVAPDTASEL